MSAATGRIGLLKIDAAALLLALVLTGVVYWLGIEPALAKRRQDHVKQEALGPQEAQRDQQALELQLATERLKVAKAELTASPLHLEPVGQINHRLVKITELAADVGLSLDQFTPGVQKPTSDAVIVPLRLTGRGDFPSDLLFLSRLHADFSDMAVTGFRLTGNSGGPSATGTFVFDLAWYAAPEGAAGDRQALVPLP